MVHRRSLRAKAAASVVLLALLQSSCGTVEVGSLEFSSGATDEALDPSVDRLDFLAPLMGEPWLGVIGDGDEALAVRLEVAPIIDGRVARVVTHVRGGDAWIVAIEGHLGWDPVRERVRYRAWSVDGAYFDGSAYPTDGGVALVYDLSSPSGSARFERRYQVEPGGLCTRRTRRLTDDGAGEWIEDPVLRRPVRDAALEANSSDEPGP